MDAIEHQWPAMRALAAGLSAAGVEHCVVAPGSRSGPLALAFARDPGVAVHVVIDERSAGFRALGIARATGRPAAVVCTSGSAAAHLHPAVLEAHHARVPMVVLTADRPPELLDTGAGQTIDQIKLFGPIVRWHHAPGVADSATAGTFAPIGVRAATIAIGPPGGPVHLDIALREPLSVPAISAPGEPAPARPDTPIVASLRDRPAIANETVDAVAALLDGVERGVVVAGWGSGAPGGVLAALARDLGWPLLADPISNARVGPNAISAYDALARHDAVTAGLVPDVVLRFGAPLTGRAANAWLRSAGAHIVVDADDSWLDPGRTATTHVRADAAQLASRLSLMLASGGFRPARAQPSPWLQRWLDVERRVRSALDRHLDADDEPFDGRIARDTLAALPDGSHLLVASSMPVRDMESFAAPRAGVTVHSNRGVNGIDGLVSTAAGIATGSRAPTFALLGDLALLHDTNGLLGLSRAAVDLTLVVVDNDGGGIFSFLPHLGLPKVDGRQSGSSIDEFETYFATPHGLDLTALLVAHGVPSATPTTATDFAAAIAGDGAPRSPGVRAIVVRTDRLRNVARHAAVWDAIRSGLRA